MRRFVLMIGEKSILYSLLSPATKFEGLLNSYQPAHANPPAGVANKYWGFFPDAAKMYVFSKTEPFIILSHLTLDPNGSDHQLASVVSASTRTITPTVQVSMDTKPARLMFQGAGSLVKSRRDCSSQLQTGHLAPEGLKTYEHYCLGDGEPASEHASPTREVLFQWSSYKLQQWALLLHSVGC